MLYGSNVLAALMTVLFSEPRSGMFGFTRHLVQNGRAPWWEAADVLTAILTTLLCCTWGVGVLRRWRSGELSRTDRVGLVSVAVIGANAVIGYGYAKDVIMSAGGAVFALVVWAALHAIETASPRPGRRWMAMAMVAVISAGWALQAASVPGALTTSAFKTRNDWASVEAWLETERIDTSALGAAALVQQLRTEALQMPVPHPSTPIAWLVDRR